MTEPSIFFDNFLRYYQKAVNNSNGIVSFYYEIAGFKVKLCFAGVALIPYITPALSHLTTESFLESDLTIFLWDSYSTNILLPPPLWKVEDYQKDRLIKVLNNEGFQTIFQQKSISLSMIDKERNLGIYWVKNPEAIPQDEIAVPLLHIFHFWMQKNQIQLCHAAALGKDDFGVLLVGKSGSGKSTLINETLVKILMQKIYQSKQVPLSYSKIEGLEFVDKVIEIDKNKLKHIRNNIMVMSV